MPPAPETHQQGQSVGPDERTPVNKDDSEGFIENRTEETSATVVKISPFKKDFLSIDIHSKSGSVCGFRFFSLQNSAEKVRKSRWQNFVTKA